MPTDRETDRTATSDRIRRDAGRWLALAVAALAVSGALAVVLVVGRVPALAPALIQEPELARRSLVVHVNLSVGVWFFAFIAGLFCLLPGARSRRTAPLAVLLATLGVIALTIPLAFHDAPAVLSNYVPALDDRLFLVGLGLFAAGVTLNFADARLVTGAAASFGLPLEARHGLRAAALTFLVAMATFAAAFLTQDPQASPLVYFERLFWGGGHVLQASATMAMLSVWLLLLHRLTGRRAVSPRLAVFVFAAMLLPTLLGPWLTLAERPNRAFTTMMQLGIFPSVGVVMWSGIAALRRRGALTRRAAHSPAFVGLVTSGAMTVLGFVYGAGITANTTMTPAHYHVNIGAVTVSFMTLLLVLLPSFGAPLRWRRLATWQPLIYGVGQTVFATGLGIAGFWGKAARKVYGAEQQLDAPVERVGLIIAGLGGVLALAGGVVFIGLVVQAWTRRHDQAADPHDRV